MATRKTSRKRAAAERPRAGAVIGRLLRECGLWTGRALPTDDDWIAQADRADRKARRGPTRVDEFLSRCFDELPGSAIDRDGLLGSERWTPAKLARLARPMPAGGSARAAAARGRGTPASGDWVTSGLTKEQFLSRNDERLMVLLGQVNSGLRQRYGAGAKAVSREDLWVVFYVECGLRNGRVDPGHTHSEGERGMLPLPSNIRAWNGPSAPRWDRPMSVPVNLEHFFLYMGHLKNKDQSGAPRHLYRGLFRLTGIAGNVVREAKVLAGVVHGYFYSDNYADRVMPYDHLVRGYREDRPLSEMMATTRYRHAGTAVMTGREANINTALRLV